MNIEKISDYRELGKRYVPEQYKSSERLLGIINEVLSQCNELETAFFEILNALSLEDAIGPALGYLGEVVGVKRIPGETDEDYRVRIVTEIQISGVPTTEALRSILRFVTGVQRIGIYPVWPAGLTYVLYGATEQRFEKLAESVASGVDGVQGTFLRCEDLENIYILDEDHGQPFVIEYAVKDLELYELITDTGDDLVDENGDSLAAMDF